MLNLLGSRNERTARFLRRPKQTWIWIFEKVGISPEGSISTSNGGRNEGNMRGQDAATPCFS